MKSADRPSERPPAGKLDWRKLLDWLREDGLIEREDADRRSMSAAAPT